MDDKSSPSGSSRRRRGKRGCYDIEPSRRPTGGGEEKAARSRSQSAPAAAGGIDQQQAAYVQPPLMVQVLDDVAAPVSNHYRRKLRAIHASRRLPRVCDILFRGYGQVMFLDSAISGFLVLASLFVEPWLGLLALVGGSAATGAIIAAGVSRRDTDAGLLTHNGVLVGCAFAVFFENGKSWRWRSAVATCFGGAASAFVSLALQQMQTGKATPAPAWTWGFNAVALPTLLLVRPLDMSTPQSEPVAWASSLSHTNATTTTTTAMASSSAVLDGIGCFRSALAGISQVFVLDSAIGGGLQLVAMLIYRPVLGLMAVAASATGSLTGYWCGAPAADVVSGLWGYNAVLTALSVAVFFVPTPAALVLAVAGAVGTAVVGAGLATASQGAFGTPVLTLPFCLMATVCFALGAGGKVPGLRLAPPVLQSREGNHVSKRVRVVPLPTIMKQGSQQQQRGRRGNPDEVTIPVPASHEAWEEYR